METETEHNIETGIIWWFGGIRVYCGGVHLIDTISPNPEFRTTLFVALGGRCLGATQHPSTLHVWGLAKCSGFSV